MLQNIVPWIENNQRWFRYPLLLLMVAVGVSISWIRPEFVEQLELKLLDEQFKIRGEIPHDTRVIIVGVNNNDLTEVGRWPWSRDKITTIVSHILGQYQAKALGFDIVFSEQQLNPVDEALRLIRVHEHDAGLEQAHMIRV